METFTWSRCFLCLSEDSEEALVRKERVVKAFETSCQYLIDEDEVRKGVLRLFEDDQGKTEGLEVVLCGSCGEVAESVQELHVELEEIRRRLLGRVKVLQDIVVRNSRLYGTNGRAKKDLEELEEWVDAQEKLGRRSVDSEKRFLKLLHGFQTLVFEKDFEARLSPPAVIGEKLDDLEGLQEDVKVEVDPDDIPSEVEMEDGLDLSANEEEAVIKAYDNLEVVSSSSVSSEDDGGSERSEEWMPLDDSLRDKKIKKKAASNRRTASRTRSCISQPYESSGNIPEGSLTEAQLLAADLRRYRRFLPVFPSMKYKSFACLVKKCRFGGRGSPRFERHLREEHETSEKNFSCPDCRHEFTTKDMLDIHLVFHCGLLSVNCHLCSVAIAPKDMKDHLESTHNLESLHHCQFCNMCFGHYIGLVDHLASHGMISFNCVECGNEDSTFTHPEYVQHLFQAHGNGDAHTSSVVLPCDFPNCTSFFLNPSDLNDHKRIHFKCTYCDTECNTPKRLEVHLRTEHKIGNRFPCDACDKSFLRKNKLDRHKSREHEKKLPDSKFKCDLCPKKYVLKASLTDHKKNCHGPVSKRFECEHCHKILGSSSSLCKHRLTHREEKRHICDTCGYSTNHGNLMKEHLLTHEGVLNYFCSHCPKAFSTQKQLSNHLRYHSDPGDKLDCDLCDFVGLNRHAIYSHKKTVHGPPTQLPPDSDVPNVRHECSTCHAKFTTKISFFKHLAMEHGEKPYVCKICEATFAHKAGLFVHRRQHQKDKQTLGDFKCPHCPRQLSTSQGFRIHIRRYHPSTLAQRSFQCDLCPSAFTHRVNLRFHQRKKHGAPTGARGRKGVDPNIKGPPFTCPHCSKIYKSYTALWNHLPSHSEKNFVCDKCSAAFYRKANLDTHKKAKHYEGSETGKKLKCETCGLESIHLLSFRQHLKSHDEAAKIFACDKCPKKFAQRRLLQQHLYTHSTENQYRCEECNSTFRHSASLWDHKRKKHPT